MNKTPVIVLGANGKMGALAVETIAKHPEFQVVAKLSRGDNLSQTIINTQAKIVLDLTSAESVYANCLTIIEHGAHPVIGASGLLDSQIEHLQILCDDKMLGGIIVPNFSIGAVLMIHFAGLAAQWMSEVEIIETHHQQKLDAPSGTALKTAEVIAAARKIPKNELPLKEIIAGVRGGKVQDVHIHSLRLPGVIARQQVIFGGLGETLTINHESIDRASFMPGVMLACQEVLKSTTLQYGLEHFLFD